MYLIDSGFQNLSCVPEYDTPLIFLSLKMMIIDENMNWIECRINNAFMLLARLISYIDTNDQC